MISWGILVPIKKNKISYKLDLEAEFNKKNIKPSKRKSLSELIGVTLIDEITQYLDKGTTPVSKGKYKRSLNKEYKEKKTKEGKKGFADMQLTESMLNNLTIKPTKKDVEIKLTDSTEKKKAYAHNTGYKGHPSLENPKLKRQWLPDDDKGETFKRTITKKIKDIINDASDD